MRRLEIGPRLKAQVTQYLQKQGCEITEEAKFLGTRGAAHTFDMLAQKDDGFTIHTAICFVPGGE